MMMAMAAFIVTANVMLAVMVTAVTEIAVPVVLKTTLIV